MSLQSMLKGALLATTAAAGLLLALPGQADGRYCPPPQGHHPGGHWQAHRGAPRHGRPWPVAQYRHDGRDHDRYRYRDHDDRRRHRERDRDWQRERDRRDGWHDRDHRHHH